MKNNLHNSRWIFVLIISIVILGCSTKTTMTQSRFIEKEETAKTVTATVDKKSETDSFDYYKETYFRYEDYTYVDNIKTILFNRDGWELSNPIIKLNSDEKLFISFDDLDGDLKYYRYTVIHCDAFWNPSDLLQNEYIEGFMNDDIEDYHYSLNTAQEYTNYQHIFPTEDLKITKSGNYILKVFLEEDEENIVFTRRFMVMETKLSIEEKVKRPTSINDRNYKQEIDFDIYTHGYQIINPYKNLKVIIKQNGRWDNAITDLKPFMIKNDVLDYNYDEENVFNGGNEFRNFDIKSLKYNSERISEIIYNSNMYHVYLRNDHRRTFKIYHLEDDINGKKLITTEDANNSFIEGEYVQVHFFLPYNAPLVDGNLYVFGALTCWNYTKEGKLHYNYDKSGYETTLFLKQGFYDYQYVFLESGQQEGDETFIEGNHRETNNDYTIYVYYRKSGSLYDKLVAVKHFVSAI